MKINETIAQNIENIKFSYQLDEKICEIKTNNRKLIVKVDDDDFVTQETNRIYFLV